MLDAQGVCDEAWVSFPFRLAEFVAEDAVELVVAAANGDVGVFCFVRAVWYYSCWYRSALTPMIITRRPGGVTYHERFPIARYPSFL